MVKREDVTTLKNDQVLGWKQTEGRRDDPGKEQKPWGDHRAAIKKQGEPAWH